MMAQYLSQKELIKAIETNLTNLELGSFNLAEIEQHLEMVRELYERTIALRYKAYEHHSTISIAKPQTQEIIQEIDLPTSPEETFKQEPKDNEALTEPVSDAQEESHQEIEFDFFGTPEIEETGSHSENSFEITLEEQQEEKEKPMSIHALQQEGHVNLSSEEAIRSEPTEQVATTSSFKQRVLKIDQETRNQFGFQSLSTLIGSFGLNERLLYINELFDGSSESFSDAIKQLDNRSDLSEATTYLEEIGTNYNWELESETVEEFIQKICRRYA